MNRSIYLQILVLAVFISFMGSLNTYAQDASAGPIPEIYLNKHLSVTPNQNTPGYNPLATLAYGYGAQIGQTLSMPLPVGQPFTNLAAFTFPSFASSMTKGGDGNYYLTTTYSATGPVIPKLYTVSTAGVVTLLGDITGTGTNSVNGISYNPNNSTYYLMGATTPTNSLLYSFDVNTRVATLIGTVGTGALMIDLCFDFSGTCYTYDLVTDNAYTVDITTGTATLLGPLGFAANFGQGMGYDFETGWIYLSGFRNLPSNDGQLRVMDPQTGYTNFLASYGVNQVAPFAPASTIAALPGPGRATNPTIANGATNVLISTPSIGWTNAGGATSVEVFFGTNPQSLTSIYSGAVVTSQPVTLAYSTTYYWYVNETSGAGTTKGTLWSFTTEAEPIVVVPLPVIVDFEDGIFPPTGWSLSAGTLWKTSDFYVQSSGASGYGVGAYSALADFYVEGPPAIVDLISIEFNSAGASNPTLSFDWAYATYINDPDELDIFYSTDAGATWTILLAMPGGLNGILNPFNLATTSPYFPANNEWSTLSLPLPAGTNKVKFTAVSAFGNWLYLDNIGISDQFFDNFDSYITGQQLCGQTTNWVTWSGPTGTPEDPFVSSTYAFSPSNSVRILPGNDVVRVNGPVTSGVWYLSWMTYIPTGKAGYFNTLSDFAGGASEFAMQAFFNPGGTGTIDAAGASSASFFYPHDTWFQVWMKVDLDSDLATLRINGSLVYTWQYTLGTFGSPPIALQLDANDFYGGTAADEMYIDNYYYSAIPSPIQLLPADAGMVSIDLGIAIAPGSPSPQATVRNYGGETQTFPVTMTIGTYSSTKTVTALAPDATAQVTFDPWTAVTGGPFTVNVCTELVGDLNNANNCLSQPLYVWDDSGAWTSGANYPTTTFLGTGTSWIETTPDATIGHLFSLGGVDPAGLTTAASYDYNVNTNTWTAIAPMPADRDRFASATVDDFIIAMGGYPENVTVPQGTVWKYDINANSWSAVAPLPTGEERGWHKAVSYNNYVYVAGGITGDIGGSSFEYESSVLVYDVTANTWSTATSMPGARFGGAFARSGNQLVYIGGASPEGIASTVFVGTIDAGNPAIINWTTELKMFPGAQNKSYIEYSANLVESISPQTNPKGQSRLVGGTPTGALYRFDAATWGTDGVIVTTGAPGGFVPADPNYCFVYYPGTDTWSAQENLPTPVVGSSLGTVNDGNTWKLIVAAGSNGTVGLNTTQIYTQTVGGSSTFQLSVDIANGWNMVSIPGLHPVDQNVSTWWAFRDLGANVFRYAGGYQSVTAAVPGTGYWMKHAGVRTYNTGDEWPAGGINVVPHDPITAALGWNLFGGYELSVTATNVTTVPSGLQSGSIFQYSGGYQVATTIDPGYGYWIKLDAAGQIIIPETMAKGEAVEYFAEDWGRIILTDATGINYTLYAVKGEVNLDDYELPPAPPTGMFDIRFSSGRIAENINSSVKTIDMSGVTYPLTVRVEGMDVRLMDETGKGVNVNLKSGEDVEISDATIQKLMVSGELVPAEYALEQNYPNPFNPSTVIEFSLPENVGNVKLSIYNMLGEKVAELVNTALTAGKYQYQWNAQNVATGMYIYELRTDNFVSVKKMLLLK